MALCRSCHVEAGVDHLEQHIAALGLMSVSSYKLWCRRHGLSMELDKTASEREAELELLRRLRGPEDPEADPSHCQQRADFIRRIASGELDGEKLSDVMTRIRRLFTEVHHGSRAVPASQRNIVLSGLSQVGLHHARWLRPVEAWRPDSRNPTQAVRASGKSSVRILLGAGLRRWMDQEEMTMGLRA
jgi:hypothetical protein